MPERSELRISLRKVLAALALVTVPVSLVGLYVTSRSDKLLEQSLGAQFKAVAETGATTTAQFISDRIRDCKEVAAEPSLIDALTASDKASQASASAMEEKAKQVEANWSGKESEATVTAIRTSPAASVLRRRRQLDPRFLLIIAADERGRTVAASDKPATYLQTTATYWDGVYAQGKGAVVVRDVRYDSDTHAYYAGIAVPVLDSASSRFLGAVYALVDVSPLLVQLNAMQTGTTAKTILAKEEGVIVSAPNVNLAMNLKSEEYVVVQDSMGDSRIRQAGYLIANMRDGSRNIVGFADLRSRTDIPSLPWVVMVSQDLKQATAPMRDIERFALLMVIMGLLLLTLVAMYFFTHRTEEFEEIPALHENPSRA